jgi:hypothetical protein
MKKKVKALTASFLEYLFWTAIITMLGICIVANLMILGLLAWVFDLVLIYRVFVISAIFYSGYRLIRWDRWDK